MERGETGKILEDVPVSGRWVTIEFSSRLHKCLHGAHFNSRSTRSGAPAESCAPGGGWKRLRGRRPARGGRGAAARKSRPTCFRGNGPGARRSRIGRKPKSESEQSRGAVRRRGPGDFPTEGPRVSVRPAPSLRGCGGGRGRDATASPGRAAPACALQRAESERGGPTGRKAGAGPGRRP